MRLPNLLIRLFLLLLTGAAWAGQPEPLQFARNELLPEQDVAERVFRKVCDRLDLDVTVEPLPPARANQMTLAGDYDGEIARIESYGERNPSLIRVNSPHYYLTSVVYARTDNPVQMTSPADLLTHEVGVIRGVQHSMDLTRDHPRVVLASDSQQLFRMLELGRVELIVTTGIDGRYMNKKLQLSNIREAGTLARRDLYIYLHPSHKELASRLATELNTLRQSGELDRLMQEAEEAFLQN